jgi:malate dehydrogenase (oxaloacetate-decarboxylating)(NADP+)
MGVAASLISAMQNEGCSAEEARSRFWIIDKDGLIGPERDRSTLSGIQELVARTAEDEGEGGSDTRLHDKASLLDVVAKVRPTIMLGFTGVGGAWKEEVVREMARHIERPIIFPLSNPTSNAECTAEQAYAWTEGRAVFGGGSPFDAVTMKDPKTGLSKTIQPSQINNMFIFPGMGLASVAVRPRRITDAMFYAAAKAMSEMVSQADLEMGRVVPRVRDIREVSAHVAAAAAQCAIAEGIVQKMPPAGNLVHYMQAQMYYPQYVPVFNDVYK